jgi:uncharacterized membrane protein
MEAWKRLNGGGLNFMISALIWIAIIGLLAVLVIPVLVLMAFLTLENQNLEDIDWRDED